jgi:hypothetical protein
MPPKKSSRPRFSSAEIHTGLVLGAAGAAGALIWVPWLAVLAYPFRLLVTLVHELSHGLTALATGGYFRNFVVFGDGSGLAYTAGGWPLLVVPAGYLGAAAFGAVLILLGTGKKSSRWALGAVGLGVALFSLRYGLPSLLHEHAEGGLLAVVSGSILGGLLFLCAWKASDRWIVFTIYLVAFLSGVNAFSDLWTLIGISSSPTTLATDAQSMAGMTLLPAVFWAVLWALCSALILAAAVRAAWNRGRV